MKHLVAVAEMIKHLQSSGEERELQELVDLLDEYAGERASLDTNIKNAVEQWVSENQHLEGLWTDFLVHP